MAIKTVEWVEKWVPVNKLTGIDVEFISLVPKGANQIPFQIVKADTGKETTMIDTAIQKLQRAVADVRSIQDDVRTMRKQSDRRANEAKELAKLQEEVRFWQRKIEYLAPVGNFTSAFNPDTVPLEKSDDTGIQSRHNFWKTDDSLAVVKDDSAGGHFWPW
ncbi:hypothetical protein [Desulfomonile tiedjei]|uniref:Uncharacterized protein n=1 Tax=Desulfomonile tiedjei (strain ATCC 49306 / DSM 6799 / DCB-1) TaxID=706587 RepID=I4CE24_DESTA|nr:hypothetical protein [Desulfomonile tiedjei]AFM27815.1 hypothetical protein Desti_5218 [Desulfomonile tiedjei DSM 6799]